MLLKRHIALLLAFSIVVNCSLGAGELYFHPLSSNYEIVLAGEIPLADYPQVNDNSQKVWNVVKGLFAQRDFNQVLPIIYFNIFSQKKMDSAWIDFQNFWKESLTELDDNPVNDHNLTAYSYDQTNVIQIAPASFTSRARRFTRLNLFYTMGHEMMHYVLASQGHDYKLHHCLIVKERENKKSLSHQLMQKLIDNKLGNYSILQLIRMEESFNFCQQLSVRENEMIDEALYFL